MAKLHHATVKRATKLGVEIVEGANGEFYAARGNQLSIESYPAATNLLNAVEDDSITWEKRVSGYCGVMVASYHDRYEHNVHGPGSCDGLDCALRDAYTDPKTGIDRDGIIALAMELELYNPTWEALNNGMVRMNASNRIRAWLRNNADAALTIDGVTGRFGVAYRPAGKTARRLAKAA